MEVAAEKGRDNEDRDLRALCTTRTRNRPIPHGDDGGDQSTGVPGIVIIADILTPWLSIMVMELKASDR